MGAPATILVFAKAPVAGQVKTRLAKTIGEQDAAILYRNMISRTLELATRIAPGGTELWVTPDSTHPFFAECAARFGVAIKLQTGSDLGERMARALSCSLREGRPALLIGTDCPEYSEDYLREAWAALQADCDVVLGPAADGGYVLVGGRAPCDDMFRDISWSTPQVLAQTRAKLRDAGIRWHELNPLRDLDCADDLQYFKGHSRGFAEGVAART